MKQADVPFVSGNADGQSGAGRTSPLCKPIADILIIAIIGLIAYSNTFNVPFVFDDPQFIRDNPSIRDLYEFTDPLQMENSPSTGTRYVAFLTFALNYALNGLDVTGYHIFNISIHVINALLVYWFVLLAFQSPFLRIHDPSYPVHIGEKILNPQPSYASSGLTRLTALFSALLFVSHPIQTEAVTYLWQRVSSLATMFFLLSLICYIKSRLSVRNITRGASYAVCVLSAILAMKTKEISFTLPIIIVLYEFLFLDGNIKKRTLYLIPILLTMSIIPFSLLGTDKPLGDLISDVSEATKVQTTLSRLDYLFTQFRVIVTYIRLLFIPVNQNLDYDYPIYNSFQDPDVFLSCMLLISLLGFGIFLLYRTRATHYGFRLAAFGIFWFFITSAVESSFIPIVDVIFEHRVYLPSVGALLAVAVSVLIAADKFEKDRPVLRKILVVALASVVIVFSCATYARNAVWHNELTLCEDMVKKSPLKARTQNNVGLAYHLNGWVDRAIEHYQIALSLDPYYMTAHNNLYVAYMQKGNLEKARLHLSYIKHLHH